MTLIPGEVEAGRFLSSMPGWSTELVYRAARAVQKKPCFKNSNNNNNKRKNKRKKIAYCKNS